MALLWETRVWSIWKGRDYRMFQQKVELLQTLLERIKLQSFLWLKSSHATFDFNYLHWRLNPRLCLMSDI